MAEAAIYYFDRSERPGSFGKERFQFVLVRNDWKDEDYGTLSDAWLIEDGVVRFLGGFRTYFKGHRNTHAVFRAMPGKEPVFEWSPPNSLPFISIAEDASVYRRLGDLPVIVFQWFLNKLNDAPYLLFWAPNDPALALLDSDAFETSLAGLSSKNDVLLAGLEVMGDIHPSPRQFAIEYKFQLNGFASAHHVQIHLDLDSILPKSLAVFLGKNGTGKTRSLLALANKALGKDPTEKRLPKFSKVVLIGLSPFSPFKELERSIKRGVQPEHLNRLPLAHVSLSSEDFQNSTDSGLDQLAKHLANILEQDLRYHVLINDYKHKVLALRSVLQKSLGVDDIRVTVQNPRGDQEISIFNTPLRGWNDGVQKLINALRKPEVNIYLSRGGGEFQPSAGQVLFLLIAAAVVDHSFPESIVLIDEPELGLHPNYEVTFVEMALNLMSATNCVGILATHSAVIAREFPSSQVRVFSKSEDGIPSVDPPSIATFGADISAITNYVFQDVLVTSPHKKTLDMIAASGGTFPEVSEQFGHDLSPEALTYLEYIMDSQKRDS